MPVEKVSELEAKIFDLQITNRAKDHFIERLQADRDVLLDRIATSSHRIGQLEERFGLQGDVKPGMLGTEREPTDGRKDSTDASDDASLPAPA